MYGTDNQVVEAQSQPLSQHMCCIIDLDKLGLPRTHKLFCEITELGGSEVDMESRR